MSSSMTKFHGFFCNVRQILCSLYISLIKKYVSVFSSVFDKTRQEKLQKFGLNVENREKMGQISYQENFISNHGILLNSNLHQFQMKLEIFTNTLCVLL
jgi:hypothetical protein